MGSLAAVVVGATLIAVAAVESLTTTIAVSRGAGPLTQRYVAFGWRLMRSRHRPGGSHLLSAGGVVLVVSTVMIWLATLWAGWSLVFLAGDPGVVEAESRRAASTGSVVYFAGLTLFTLGVGDVIAVGTGWRIASVVASLSGLFLVTLAITYLLSVVSALVGRRALAIHIDAMGTRAEDIVATAWSRTAFSEIFHQHLVDLHGQITTVAEQHLAYPVLHTFHSWRRRACTARALAELDDALLIMDRCVAGAARPPVAATRTLRRAIGNYLDTVGTGVIDDGRSPTLPSRDLEGLRAAGIPLLDDDTCRERFARDLDRRRTLAAHVRAEGW